MIHDSGEELNLYRILEAWLSGLWKTWKTWKSQGKIKWSGKTWKTWKSQGFFFV